MSKNFSGEAAASSRAMLKRLAEEEKLEKKTVGTVAVETAKPLAKAALY